MKVKLPSGVILESDNQSIYEQWIKYGAKEVKAKTKDTVKSTVSKPNDKKDI